MREAAGENLLYRVDQIRNELADVTSFLAGVTTIESIGSKSLPRNTRKVIYKSVLRMIELQKQLAELEAQLGANMGIEFEQLNSNHEYWQGMVDSNDCKRSHHNGR